MFEVSAVVPAVFSFESVYALGLVGLALGLAMAFNQITHARKETVPVSAKAEPRPAHRPLNSGR